MIIFLYVKNIKLKYASVPDEKSCRLQYLDELLEVIEKVKSIENFSEDDMKEMISAHCTT